MLEGNSGPIMRARVFLVLFALLLCGWASIPDPLQEEVSELLLRPISSRLGIKRIDPFGNPGGARNSGSPNRQACYGKLISPLMED